MITVFRVQDAGGRGPFRPGFAKRWVKVRADHDNLAPWYIEFAGVLAKINAYNGFIGSGCKTVDQLRRWFSRAEYNTLLGYGFRAVRLNTDTILVESSIQCVFGRPKPFSLGASVFRLY